MANPVGQNTANPANVNSSGNSVVDIIAKVAQEKGIPVGLALSIADWESGLNPNNIGDNGHSVGLFQLNDNGEGAGMSVAQREDPRTNAEIALSQVAQVYHANPGMSWGEIAIKAQRPAQYTWNAYESHVNAAQAQYQNAPAPDVAAAYASKASDLSGTTAGGSGTAGSGLVAGTADTLAGDLGGDYSTAFLQQIVPDLMKKYNGQDLTSPTVIARFKADLMNSQWYRSTADSQRAWQALQASNPAEASHQILVTQQQLAQQAAAAGVQIPQAELAQMARDALQTFGTSIPSSYIQGMIGQHVNYTSGGSYSGDMGKDITELKNLSTQYGVPLSDQTMNAWLHNIVTNGVDPNSYTDYLKQQSESLYPTLATQLKQGLTFQQAADPYRQLAAQTLNIDPNSVDFSQPKWQKALQVIDPNTGQRTAMSLDQWKTTMMSDPSYGYDKTPQARSDAADLANTIAQAFGAVA